MMLLISIFTVACALIATQAVSFCGTEIDLEQMEKNLENQFKEKCAPLVDGKFKDAKDFCENDYNITKNMMKAVFKVMKLDFVENQKKVCTNYTEEKKPNKKHKEYRKMMSHVFKLFFVTICTHRKLEYINEDGSFNIDKLEGDVNEAGEFEKKVDIQNAISQVRNQTSEINGIAQYAKVHKSLSKELVTICTGIDPTAMLNSVCLSKCFREEIEKHKKGKGKPAIRRCGTKTPKNAGATLKSSGDNEGTADENQSNDTNESGPESDTSDQTDGQADGQADDQADGQADDQTDDQTDGQADDQADGQADDQADDQAEGQAEGQADEKTEAEGNNDGNSND